MSFMHDRFMFEGKHTCAVTKCPPVTGKYFDGNGICNVKSCTNVPEVGGRDSIRAPHVHF